MKIFSNALYSAAKLPNNTNYIKLKAIAINSGIFDMPDKFNQVLCLLIGSLAAQDDFEDLEIWTKLIKQVHSAARTFS